MRRLLLCALLGLGVALAWLAVSAMTSGARPPAAGATAGGTRVPAADAAPIEDQGEPWRSTLPHRPVAGGAPTAEPSPIAWTGPGLRGRVVDSSGAPVTALVQAFAFDRGRQRRSGIAARDGVFWLDVSGEHVGRWGVVARAPGYANSGTLLVDVGAEGAWCNLRLREAGTLSGVVLAEGGAPVAGVSVLAAPVDLADLRSRLGKAGATAIDVSDPWSDTVTSASGAFSIPGLPVDLDYDLRVFPIAENGCYSVVKRGVHPRSSPVQVVLTYAELATTTAEVQFIRPDGRPAVIHRAEVLDGGRTVTSRPEEWRDGVVHVSALPPGQSFRLRVGVADWGLDEFGPWTAESAPRRFEHQLPALGTVRCRVVDASGAPVVGARVFSHNAAKLRRVRTTDARGLCVFDAHPPGAWSFRLEDEADPGRALSLEPAAYAELEIRVAAK